MDQPDQFIIGELFELTEPSALLTALDEYEGPEFERALSRALTANGRSTECWIYWYIGPEAGRLIASGEWLKR